MRSEEELFPVDSILWLVNELELSVLSIERAELQRVQFQSETGTHLLKVGAAAVIIELVAVLPEKDEVALVVHRDDSARREVRDLRE